MQSPPTPEEIGKAAETLEALAENSEEADFNPWALEPLVEWIESVIKARDLCAAKAAQFLTALRENPPNGCGLELGILAARGTYVLNTLRSVLDHVAKPPSDLDSVRDILVCWHCKVAQI